MMVGSWQTTLTFWEPGNVSKDHVKLWVCDPMLLQIHRYFTKLQQIAKKLSQTTVLKFVVVM